jgi:peptide-methionine (S)-S-oxide reductase
VTTTIVDHLDRHAPPTRQHQLDYTVELIATGKVPREAGVQLPLIDALITRGARASGLDATVAHNEMAAARRLIHHGAPLTLTAALCLGLEHEAQRLLPDAGPGERGDALLAAASLGLTDAIRFLLDAGIDPSPARPTCASFSSMPAPRSPCATRSGTAHPQAGPITPAITRWPPGCGTRINPNRN